MPNRFAEPLEGVEPCVMRLCELMWSLYRREDGLASHLVMPVDGGSLTRVSEQESRVLLCHLLDNSDLYYSVETPTKRQYQQSGQRPGTARIDLTVYKERAGASERILNIELKAGLCPQEAFRKDFEKLVREGVSGVWFHTLETASRRNLDRLFHRIRSSFAALEEHLGEQEQTLLFAFCSLSSPRAHVVELNLPLSSSGCLRLIQKTFRVESLESVGGQWRTFVREAGRAVSLGDPSARFGSPATASQLGLRSRQLVRMDLPGGGMGVRLLTVKGTGYRLRTFTADGLSSPFTDLRAGTIGELMDLEDVEVITLSPVEGRPGLDDAEHWRSVFQRYVS